MGKVARQTVDLSGFPDLVVIYLGMRVNAWAGLKTYVTPNRVAFQMSSSLGNDRGRPRLRRGLSILLAGFPSR
jgi:hypothetical protein